MSPEPLINLQRRLSPVGAIRAGGEKQPNKPGRKLEAWRITSPRRDLIEEAARKYGGPVSQWESPVGPEWQVLTEAEELPVLVIPSYSVESSYELWEGATKRTRLCDGDVEKLTDGPCICNAEGVDKCDLYTRLVVCLPELPTALGWRLITRGAYAGHELPTMIALVQAQFAGQTFVPMRLRLDQRKSVKDGQTVRFVVPVLDLTVSYLALAAPAADGSARELPTGATPAPRREPTVETALHAVAAPTKTASPGRRAAAAFGPDDLDMDAEPPPVPPEPGGEQPTAPTGDYVENRQTLRLTDPQAKKLNVLVGKLRPAEITTIDLWKAVAKMRSLDAEIMAQAIDGSVDTDGVVHWAPLRDTLTRPEAMQLIDRLEHLLSQVEARTAGDGGPAAASDVPGESPVPAHDPYDIPY